MSVRILQGDVREVLRSLPEESVHCVVTSPPYWGLRDYGTGRWEGGDPECDHARYLGGHGPASAKQLTSSGTQKYQYTGACGKCGAQRIDAQLGMEPTLGEHIAVMVDVFREVRRVMHKSGTLWLNYGDCYATTPNGRSAADTKAAGTDDRTFRDKPFSTIGGVLKAKDLCMIPNRLAIALQEDGWWVRSEIIWHKPNPMPESITDRPATSHEKVWLLSKSAKYWYDAESVRRPAAETSRGRWQQDIDAQAGSTRANGGGKTNGAMKAVGGPRRKSLHMGATQRNDGDRWPNVDGGVAARGEANLRNVWTISTAAFSDAHFATFPPALVETCIKAGCPADGVVLDPFGGSGTTGLVADRLGRDCILIELNPAYVEMARKRIADDAGMFASVA